MGDDFAAGCAFGAASIEAARGAVVVLGDSVTINYGTSILAEREVRVGSRVMIGPYCVIADSDITGSYDDAAPIEIGDDVWLAARVVVRPGARIGAGAVISAGSVVEGEIPPNAVASGAPARVLRIRESGPTAPPVSVSPVLRLSPTAVPSAFSNGAPSVGTALSGNCTTRSVRFT